MTCVEVTTRRERAWRRIGSGVRDAWLVFGIAGGLLLSAELAYRAQGSVRRAIAGLGQSAAPRHPYADSAWFAGYLAEQHASYALRWQPYVYFRRVPFRGSYINVDSLGHRRTLQFFDPASPVRRVFFFGGSTMFGSFQRDEWTIPSLVARRLAAHGIRDVEVTNFGETGYVFTQEVLELVLQLRGGARPSVVIFYDGLNDVASTVQNGRPGLPQNEVNRAREFRLGRILFTSSADPADEARAFLTLMEVGAARLQFLNRLHRLFESAQQLGGSADSVAMQLAQVCAETAEVVEALGRAYGFKALYVWQPSLQATRKQLSRYERALESGMDGDEFQRRLKDVHIAVPAQLSSAMEQVAPGRFLDLSGLFADDTASVFVDELGHTTEAANAPVAGAITAHLMPLLKRSIPRR